MKHTALPTASPFGGMSQTVTVLGEVGEGRTQTLAVASLVATAGMKKHVLSV